MWFNLFYDFINLTQVHTGNFTVDAQVIFTLNSVINRKFFRYFTRTRVRA